MDRATGVSGQPRILIAVDKFKGCLTGSDVAAHLRSGLARSLPNAQIRLHPVSDGGDGFTGELGPHGFTHHQVPVVDALGRPITATYAERDGTAVIEMALASGLQLIAASELDPMRAHTHGLGQLITAAANRRPRRIIIGAGGSATSDGGAGALAALGAVLRDGSGRELQDFGPDVLPSVASVDTTALRPMEHVAIEVATDVRNPLLGPQGAAAVFGPQKGASNADVRAIEHALSHWAGILECATGRVGRNRPGAGAAGGLGFGLNVGLGAVGVDGLETFAALTGLAEAVEWAEVVITGEGSLDNQTTAGKAPSGVLKHARTLGRPCWVVAGRSELSDAQVRDQGYAGQRTLMNHAPDERSSIAEAPRLLNRTGAELGLEMAVAGLGGAGSGRGVAG